MFITEAQPSASILGYKMTCGDIHAFTDHIMSKLDQFMEFSPMT